MPMHLLMFSTDGGDVDMYVLFAEEGQGSAELTEPGKENYHYKSTGFGSVTEQIEVTADMQHYCTACTAYLAVYGYVGGAYTLQASSSGFVTLQAGSALGGHVDYMLYNYYSLYNGNQFASLSFTLTMVRVPPY